MIRHECKPCVFATFHTGEFNKHKRTQKHQTNCPEDMQKQAPEQPVLKDIDGGFALKVYLCDECHQEFPSITELDTHHTNCEFKLLLA